ncbi:unnamed protein product [Dicrocoelium dendriticum]|nr:unnamed protein product [Dicrocoelium dendriticum]
MDVVAEGDRMSQQVTFTTCCRLLEKLKSKPNTKSRCDVLHRFVQLWNSQYALLPCADTRVGAGRASFYPLLRILMPLFDHARPAYGLREVMLGRLYIKAFGIAPKGPIAQRILRPLEHNSGQPKKSDFADLIYDVVHDRCPCVGVLCLHDVNQLLDRLANAEGTQERLDAVNRFIHLATALEHKWIVRLVVRRESGCGLNGNSVLRCLHPAAPGLWDVTQDLLILCQRIAEIDPKVSCPPSPVVPAVSLFVPFRPMLCERSNCPESLCTRVQQLCSLAMDDISDVRLLLETKYDGERVQMHKSGASYRYWSRNCLEWTRSYGPDGLCSTGTLTPRLHAAFSADVHDCIIDGEMMAFDKCHRTIAPKTSGFDVKRPYRSDDLFTKLTEESVDYQPCLFVFDLLYLNGQVLTSRPLLERRRLLSTLFDHVSISNYLDIVSEEQLKKTCRADLICPPPATILEGTVYVSGWCCLPLSVDAVTTVFNNLMDHRQEGMVAKLAFGPSPYIPGRRLMGGWWKLKPDYVPGLLTDLDCLVVGGSYTSLCGLSSVSAPKRVRQFFCAVRGPDLQDTRCSATSLPCFLSFCQVSSGLTRNQLRHLDAKLGPHWIPYDRRKPNVGMTEWLRVTTERPDVWIAPQHSVALQIHASELVPTESYAARLTLRFPRVVAIRDDKSWQECVTLEELQRFNITTQGSLTTKRLSSNGNSTQSTDSAFEDSEDRATTFVPLSDDDADPSDSRSGGFDEKVPLSSCSISSDISRSGHDVLFVGEKRSIPCGPPRATSTPIKRHKPRTASVDSALPSSSEATISFCTTNNEDLFLQDLEFCFMLSNDISPQARTDIETRVQLAGGRLVPNPGAGTFCVVADKLTARTRNLIHAAKQSRSSCLSNSYDVALLNWLQACLDTKQLLSWRPDDLLAMRPETSERIIGEYGNLDDYNPSAI